MVVAEKVINAGSLIVVVVKDRGGMADNAWLVMVMAIQRVMASLVLVVIIFVVVVVVISRVVVVWWWWCGGGVGVVVVVVVQNRQNATQTNNVYEQT